MAIRHRSIAPAVSPEDLEHDPSRRHERHFLFRGVPEDQLIHVRAVSMVHEVRLDYMAPAVMQFFLVDLKTMAWLAVPANHVRQCLENFNPQAGSMEVITLQAMKDQVWESDGSVIRVLEVSRMPGKEMRKLLDEHMMKTWDQAIPLDAPRVPDGSLFPRTEVPPPAGPWSSLEEALPEEAEPEDPGETFSMQEDSDTSPADSMDGSETPEALGSHGPAGTESDEEIFSQME